MRISIGHVSRYTYSEPTKYSILALRLTPPSFDGQRVIDWRVIAPGIEAVRPFRDGFGNMVHLTSCTDRHSESLIIAKGVVEGSKISCSFPIPDAPPNQTIDPSTIVVNYTPSQGGSVASYKQVASLADCTAGAFYLPDQLTIALCPATCDQVQADSTAKLDILYSCGKL